MRHTIPQRGRPKKEGEVLTNRSFSFAPSIIDRLDQMASGSSITAAEHVRRAVAAYLDPTPVAVPDVLVDQSRHKFLTKAPCGPWMDALEHAGDFVLSRDVAEELGAREGDVVVRCVGDSMEGAGIPDGALLLMRPLANNRPPRRHQIALVQILNTDEQYYGTIKRWISEDRLLDGNGDPFAFPDGTIGVVPVAESVGIISLL
jgi:SOS-response transcriptional repressor LexA